MSYEDLDDDFGGENDGENDFIFNNYKPPEHINKDSPAYAGVSQMITATNTGLLLL